MKLDITLGNTKLTRVVDSGSMVNMISVKKLEESGLPSIPLKGRTVTGGEGTLTQWVHCEFVMSFEAIRLVITQQVCGEFF